MTPIKTFMVSDLHICRINKLHIMPHSNYTYITHMSNEHSSWMRGIAFYRDEIKILLERLNELTTDKTCKAGADQIEQYHNQILNYQNTMAELEQDIQANFKLIESDLEKRELHVSNSAMAQADSLRNRYIEVEKSFNEFRHAFNRFLCDNMEVVLK